MGRGIELRGESTPIQNYLESQDAESRGNDVPLSFVVRGGNSLVGAVPLHGVLSAGQLVGQHAADGLVQDTARGSE